MSYCDGRPENSNNKSPISSKSSSSTTILKYTPNTHHRTTIVYINKDCSMNISANFFNPSPRREDISKYLKMVKCMIMIK